MYKMLSEHGGMGRTGEVKCNTWTVNQEVTTHFPCLKDCYLVLSEHNRCWILSKCNGGDRKSLLDGPLVTKYIRSTSNSEWYECWRCPLVTPLTHWNYPGTLIRHTNGSLYAVHSNRISRIDAATGIVLFTTVFTSVSQSNVEDIAYNGASVLKGGHIVCKCIFRNSGTRMDGARALLRGGVCEKDSEMHIVSHVDGSVLCSIVPGGLLGGRISTFSTENSVGQHTDFVVNTSGSHLLVHRVVSSDSYTLDMYSERKIPYEGTNASAPVLFQIKGTYYAAFQTNGIPSLVEPMRVHVVNVKSGQKWTHSHSSTKIPSGTFAKLSVDTKIQPNGCVRIWYSDCMQATLGVLDFDPEHGLRVWKLYKQRTTSFIYVVTRPCGRRVVVSTDLVVQRYWKFICVVALFVLAAGWINMFFVTCALICADLIRLKTPYIVFNASTERLLVRCADTGNLLWKSSPFKSGAGLPAQVNFETGEVFYPRINSYGVTVFK